MNYLFLNLRAAEKQPFYFCADIINAKFITCDYE